MKSFFSIALIVVLHFASGCKKPLVVSHLSSENLAITRRKGAANHYFLSKVICFNSSCLGTVGWKRKQKKKRFKGYKNPSRPQARPKNDQLVTDPLIPGPETDRGPTEDYKHIEFGKPTIFKNGTFQVNSSLLQDEFQRELDGFSNFLRSNKDIAVTIIGHTDDVGTAESNQKLSEDRAMSVLEYLVHKGVDRSRLSALGRGNSEPINKGLTESDRAVNRRVEFELEEYK